MRCEACLHTPDVRVGDPDHPSQVSRAHRGLDPQSAKFLAGTPEEVCRPPRSALARRLPRRHALSLAPAAYQPLICVWNMLMFRLTTGRCLIGVGSPKIEGPAVVWNMSMFQSAIEWPSIDSSAVDWNMSMF